MAQSDSSLCVPYCMAVRLELFDSQKQKFIDRFGKQTCDSFVDRVSKRTSCEAEDLVIASELLQAQIWIYDTAGLQSTIKPTVPVVRGPNHLENCVLTDSAGTSTEHFMLLMCANHEELLRPWQVSKKKKKHASSANASTSTAEPPSEPLVDGLPSIGLNIMEPYISYILDGSKSWEIRSESTTRQGLICLVNSGKVYGTVCLKECVEINVKDLKDNHQLHQLDDDWMTRCSKWTKIYAWVLTSPQRLEHPRRFAWKLGCVTWWKITFPKPIQLPWTDEDIRNAKSAHDLAKLTEKSLPVPGIKLQAKTSHNASLSSGVCHYQIRCKDCCKHLYALASTLIVVVCAIYIFDMNVSVQFTHCISWHCAQLRPLTIWLYNVCRNGSLSRVTTLSRWMSKNRHCFVSQSMWNTSYVFLRIQIWSLGRSYKQSWKSVA